MASFAKHSQPSFSMWIGGFRRSTHPPTNGGEISGRVAAAVSFERPVVVKVRTAPPHGHLLVRSLELLLAPWLLLLCNELILCFSMDSLSHVPHLCRAERCNGVDASSLLCDRRGPAVCAVCTGRAKIPSLSWAQLLQLLCCGKLLPSCGYPVHRRLAQLFCPCFLAVRESHAKEKDRRVCGCHHSGGSWSDVGTGAFEGGYSERAQRLRVVSRWFNESLLQVIPT